MAATATCLPKFGLSSAGYVAVSGKQLPTEAILTSDHWSQWIKAGIKHFPVTNAPSHFPLPSVNRWLVNRNPQFGMRQRRKLFPLQNSSTVIHHGCEVGWARLLSSALLLPVLLCSVLTCFALHTGLLHSAPARELQCFSLAREMQSLWEEKLCSSAR